ncbi:MAG: nickel-dependent lactate racemase [Anaerolineae bacterium]|nr:nickel-dependent lactate racemase [Anaerolineae bacterium]
MVKFTYELLYGKSKRQFSISANSPPSVIEPKLIPASPAPMEVVDHALDNPVGSFDFQNFRNAKSVAIAINDKTRPVPYQYMLPPLLKRLLSIGVRQEDISFYIATGTHAPLSRDEFASILPVEMLEDFRVVVHDCGNEDLLLSIGYTHYGTPVYVNRNFFLSELKIVTGNIEPHHFMGFSGGAKSASIGLTGRRTINHNHAMLTNPNARIGEFSHNPMRQDVEEIGNMIGVQLALNVILNNDKQIVAAYAGDPRSVMYAGTPMCRQICQVKVPKTYDIVIVSPGGHPKDINLYQSQKALTNASQIVKDGGVIILAAACPEGSGSTSFEAFMVGLSSCKDVFEKFKQMGFSVGPHKAFQIAKIAERAKIILVSEMEPELVKRFLITPCDTIDAAVQMSMSNCAQDPDIAILPRAINTIPLLSE